MANNMLTVTSKLQTTIQTLQTKALPSSTDDATATAEDILVGQTAYVKGEKITGTMPNNGAISITFDGIDTKSVTIPKGYTSGGSVSLDDTIDNEVEEQSDLIAQIQEIVETLPDKGGEDVAIYDALLSGEPVSCTISGVSAIAGYAFYSHSGLAEATFPDATSIGNYAFYYCSNLTTVDFPNVSTIGSYAFLGCKSLTSLSFPQATTIGNDAFAYCRNLATVSFPKATTIDMYAFQGCYNLKSLYLAGSSVCTLYGSYVFTSTPIGGYSTSAGCYGSIYVPASLLTSYQSATNWVKFSSRFVGI